MMAAKSLIQVYRKVNPDLLHKKERVKFLLSSNFISNCNIIVELKVNSLFISVCSVCQ